MEYRVTDWHTVTQTVAGFKQSCYDEGPSYWRFNVYSDFNTYWTTASPDAVYTSQSGASPRGGHAVLIIGWSDSKGAFLCKNSWGETAGPNSDGTFWIAYTGHYYYLGFGMSNFDITCGDPIPDIKANGSDGPVTIAPGGNLSVRIALDTGSKLGDNADWWVLVQLPSGGWYHWEKTSGWKSGLSVTYQGVLFDVSSYRVLNTSSLTTPGLYKFYFAVDMIMNGSIDMDQIDYDVVRVNITP